MGRMDKINQLIKREVSLIIQQEFQDPRLMYMTVLRVEVSRDLQHADIYYSVLGDANQIEAISKTLSKLVGHIRKLVGRRIRLRYTPQIHFIYDQSVAASARMEETFREINEHKEEASDSADTHQAEEA